MNHFLRISIACTIVVGMTLQGCKKETEITAKFAQPENGTVELYAHTKVVGNSNIAVVSFDLNQLRLSGNSAQLAAVQVGDVLAAPVLNTAPNGFLVRVKSIQKSGAELILTTEQAALTDAIKNSDIHLKRTLNSELIGDRAGNSFAYTLNDLVLFDADGNASTTYDQVRVTGNGSFTPTLDMDLQISSGNVSYFNLGATFTNTITENFKAGGSVPFNVSRQIYQQNLSPITFWIGWFPIVVTPEITVKVGANGQVTAVVTASYTNTATLGAYVRYQNNAWTNGFNRSMSNTFTYGGATCNMNAKGYIQPALTARLYGSDMARASIFAQGYLLLNASLLPTTSCSLKAGVSAGADASLSILSWNIASVSYPEVFKYETTLYTCH